MRIMYWDIETAPLVVAAFGLNQPKIDYNNIISDWWIICGSWKYSDSPKVYSTCVTRCGNDKKVVQDLRDAILKADILVHHNGDKFDLKRLNTRLIYHGLEPVPLIPTVDTLKEVRKIAKFSSNRLDYLSKFLGDRGKSKSDYSWWHMAAIGDDSVLPKILKYNKRDVLTLQFVYEHLKPYMKTHPHVGALAGKDRNGSCPKCGSTNFKFNGTRVTAAGIIKHECQCNSCHSYFRIPYAKST